MKNFYIGSLLTVFLLGFVFVAVPQADANFTHGYGSSNGRGNAYGHLKQIQRGNSYMYHSNSWDYYYGDWDDLMDQWRKRFDSFRDQHYYYTSSDVSVTTRSATNVEDNEATLRGTIDLDDEDEADVFFQYGKTRTNLSKKTSETTLEDSDDEDFSRTITGLDDDTVYYFRAVARDEDDDLNYGSILTFVTDDTGNGSDEEPYVRTNSAQDITDDSAELNGTVDMNDFNNGVVFFVFGEDEDDVRDSQDEDTYSDIENDGDNIQKVKVDTDLDGFESFVYDAENLDDDTEHFFYIAVEYTDSDDDTVIEYGTIRSFSTDN